MLREGGVAEEILNVGKELGCELIVVGDKGVSKIGKFSLGSGPCQLNTSGYKKLTKDRDQECVLL